MKNRETEFLSEVRELISDLRQRIECLEKMVAEYEQGLDSEDIDIEPIDLDIEEPEVEQEVEREVERVAEPEIKQEVEPEVEEEVEPEAIGDLPEDICMEQEPVQEAAPEEGHATTSEEETEKEEDDIPVFEDNRQLWWTDMPGSPVRDIRSAISLNDRILYINTLFNEDPMIFQDAVNAINGMNSLREVVGYVKERFPQWNLDSETVYRFMMAARRRVR